MLHYTESHFGLVRNHDAGNISADGGKTSLTLPLSQEQFTKLVADIEAWWDRDKPMTDEEGESLRELLQP